MRVVIDTNVFFQDFPVAGPAFSTLFGSLKVTDHSLHIPEIVLDEVANKYGEEYQKSISSIDRLGLKRVGLSTADAKSVTAAQASLSYRKFMLDRLEDVGAEIIDYPNPAHRELVNMALKRRKPFRSSDTGGYRDVLIWHCILGMLRTDPEAEVAFISLNPKDFADAHNSKSLHPDLIDDLSEMGVESSAVSIYESLTNFVNERVKPQLEELKQLRVQLSSMSHLHLDLEQFLTEQLSEFVAWKEFEHFELGFPSSFETSHYSMLENIETISDIDVRRLSPDEILISLLVEGDAEFDVYIEKSNYYSMREEERPSIWSFDWNKWYMAGSVSSTTRMKVSLIANTQSWEITAASLDSIEPVDEWWERFYRGRQDGT